MDRVEVIWHASYVVNRDNPVDDDLFDTAESACTVSNPDRPVVITDLEIQDASRAWIADGLDVQPNQITFVSYTWSSMPWVDATALGEDAHGND